MLLTRLPLITAICLCILLCGTTYWQLSPYINNLLINNGFLETKSNLQISKEVNKNLNTKQETVERNYNIASFKLFGDALAPVATIPLKTEKLPETTLKLKLTGVLAGKDNVQASALIEGPDRQTRSYRVDEEVPGGATLKQVFADRVVLERSGRLENLIFEETRSIGIETQKQNEDQVVSQDMPTPIHSANNDPKNYNPQQTRQIKDRLSRLRNRLQNNGP